jgi:hypothetical protein
VAAGNLERFDENNFFTNTFKELRNVISAIRQDRNDNSITNAQGWMLYVNAHIDPAKNTPLSDVAVFLPHPAEYYETQQAQTLQIRPDTARLILKYYDIYSPRVRGILGAYLDEIHRIAAR